MREKFCVFILSLQLRYRLLLFVANNMTIYGELTIKCHGEEFGREPEHRLLNGCVLSLKF